MKVLGWLAVALVALGLGVATAQEVPNDLRGILYDIDRAEQQIPGLTPSRGANIKRLVNSLARTADQMEASANKTHPAWLDASARLERLNADLATLADGRMPGEAAAAPEPTAAPAPAAAAADGTGGGGLQAPTLGPPELNSSDVAKLNRLGRNVQGIFADMRTGVAPNEAQGYRDRLTGIDEQLAALPQHPDVLAVRDPIAQTVPQLDAMLGNAQAAPKAPQINSGQSAAPVELASADRAKFTRLKRNADGVFEELGALNPILLQPTRTVAQYEKTLAALVQNQTSLISQGHPDVVAVGETLVAARAILEEKAAIAVEQVASLGDFMGRLQAIRDKYSTKKTPEALRAPVTLDEAKAYLDEMMDLSRNQAADIQYINDLAPRTVLVPLQDMQSLQGWVGVDILRSIDESLTQTVANMGGWAQSVMDTVGRAESIDPANPDHVLNQLLNEDSYQFTLAELNDGMQALRVAVGFEQFLKIADTPDRGAQAARLQAALESLPEKQAIALREVRMPEADSTDPELIAIAKEVLADLQDSTGGPIARLVVSSNIHSLTQDVGNASTGGSNRTITIAVTEFVWDEFKVVTAEEESPGNFRIYYTTFRYYTAGGSDTVVNRWIVGDRTRSTAILAENIAN